MVGKARCLLAVSVATGALAANVALAGGALAMGYQAPVGTVVITNANGSTDTINPAAVGDYTCHPLGGTGGQDQHPYGVNNMSNWDIQLFPQGGCQGFNTPVSTPKFTSYMYTNTQCSHVTYTQFMMFYNEITPGG